MKAKLSLYILLLGFFQTLAQPLPKKYALVIGIKEYQNWNVLKNTVNDANDMTTILRTKGFEVTSVIDPTRDVLKAEMLKFFKSLQADSLNDKVTLIYYSGFGYEVEGRHYLIPVDAKVTDITKEGLAIDTYIRSYDLVRSQLNMFIFDCSFGSSIIETPPNSIIATGARPGSYVSDGPGRNGAFTSKLLKHIPDEGLSIHNFFKVVSEDVGSEFTGGQRPYVDINFKGEFYFTPASKNALGSGGKYYALLMGVSQYKDASLNLDRPVKDAEYLSEILTQGYSFAPGNVMILRNPTRRQIIGELFKLRQKLTSEDNLLIFFAGHGFYDEKIKQGYWWPSDALREDPSDWLSNSDIKEQIRGINTAHTLLISDACFSGGIFKTRDPKSSLRSASLDLQILYKNPSRRAMTSGYLSIVPDQSVFFEHFSKKLKLNQERFISSQQLFDSFRNAVINNSMAVPQDGVIDAAGDEGGDFIFIRKE